MSDVAKLETGSRFATLWPPSCKINMTP